MTKTKDLFPRAELPVELHSFYVPHRRVQFMNDLVNPETGEITYPPSMTKQSFLAECDINNIIKAFKVSGQIKHINERAAQGAYADLPDPIEFQEALHQVKQAQASFATLPAHVRSRFDNNPQTFLTFITDPKNQDEIIRLGLATDNRPPASAAPPAPDAT
ncbi:MAG: internal scaffolding protein [Arizlama microvirus]|nr:MAG: internal scaffolding protein [Arizlama microvirus]